VGRIVYGMMQSLDGYIAGPEAGAALPPPGEALHRVFNDLMRDTAMALYGRTMYGIMRAWETYDTDPRATPVEIEFAQIWQKVPKRVVSTTLTEIGPNARLVEGDVGVEIARLKAATGGTIQVAGAGLAASLGRLGLVDEYRLYLHPLVLGGGKPFFAAGLPMQLRFLGSEKLPQDVMLLRYEPAT